MFSVGYFVSFCADYVVEVCEPASSRLKLLGLQNPDRGFVIQKDFSKSTDKKPVLLTSKFPGVIESVQPAGIPS